MILKKNKIALLFGLFLQSNSYGVTTFAANGDIAVSGTVIGDWSFVNNSGADWSSVNVAPLVGSTGILEIIGANRVLNSTQSLDVTINYNITIPNASGIAGSQSWGAGSSSVFGPSGPDPDMVGTAFGPSGILSDTSNVWTQLDGSTVSNLSAPAGTTFSQNLGLWGVDTAGFQNSYNVGYAWNPADTDGALSQERMIVTAEFSIPEPSSALMLIIAIPSLLLRRRL